MYTFGFIGTGNMGGALAEAVCRKCPPQTVCLSNRTATKAETLAKKLGCRAVDSKTAASESRYIFLGVKPQTMSALLSDISPTLNERKLRGDRFILVTMAAGLSISSVSEMCGGETPILRIMPNTPVSVGEGTILYTANELVSEEELEIFSEALKPAGLLDKISETEMDAASVLSGCGPAFMFMFIKALTNAGVSLGLSEEKARLYVEQTMAGSAKLAIETREEPEKLKLAVCSPGGTTIEGVKSFERARLDEIAADAVQASYKRTLELAEIHSKLKGEKKWL